MEIQIRDPQGRWQKVVRSYEANGDSFTTSIAWDRTFADGTLAPVGTYDVMVTARDLAGNESRETARILIPAPAARRNAAEVTAEAEAKNAAVEAGRIAMMEK